MHLLAVWIDRGGLKKYPTLLTVMFAYKVYCVIQILLSEKYETLFLHSGNQRSVVCNLVSHAVAVDDFFQCTVDDICDGCNTVPVGY